MLREIGEKNMEFNNVVMELVKSDNKESLLSMINNGFNLSSFTYKNESGINAFIKCRIDSGAKSMGDIILLLLSKEANNINTEGFISLLKFNTFRESELDKVRELVRKLSALELRKVRASIFADQNDNFEEIRKVVGSKIDIDKNLTKVNLKNIFVIRELMPKIIVSSSLDNYTRQFLISNCILAFKVDYIEEEDALIAGMLGSDMAFGIADFKKVLSDADNANLINEIFRHLESPISLGDKIDFLKEIASEKKSQREHTENHEQEKILAQNIKRKVEDSPVFKLEEIPRKDEDSAIIKVLPLNDTIHEGGCSIDVDRASINKESIQIDSTKEDETFAMLGDSNFKISSINAFVSLENNETCEIKNVTLQADSVKDLEEKINAQIAEFNKENDEKLINSVVEMMKNDSNFKDNLLKMMKETQLRK